MGEHPIAKELRYMRICFVIFIIITLFSSGGKVVEISSNHDSSPVNLQTNNMTQIGENIFAIRVESENVIKIFKYDPTTNKITQMKEFNPEDGSTYEYQLNKAE
ncbi:YmzC family protein [Bacillus sp. DX1.1]|uniref:YmzC family protein n=1 Tax=unclassified Bacillus (in: firmicutes) TaxID=185979 RepID=UPI00257000B6|nr:MULTISPECIES: YmzC family protein [unclassified Bacillus (in: firmicutes)]MDM5155753.1 YmzC family protein [Bacillus sp. DX1.1]WJE80052.1 YmzC family protein [Bacillus sp. DX3.1]